jgi:hypothetical protein
VAALRPHEERDIALYFASAIPKAQPDEIEALGSYLSFVACLLLTVMGRST